MLSAFHATPVSVPCLLYTSDAADEEDSVDLGGRRIIKKKNEIGRVNYSWQSVQLNLSNADKHSLR